MGLGPMDVPRIGTLVFPLGGHSQSLTCILHGVEGHADDAVLLRVTDDSKPVHGRYPSPSPNGYSGARDTADGPGFNGAPKPINDFRCVHGGTK